MGFNSLSKVGKRSKLNAIANKKLKRLYFDKDITFCELGFNNCTNNIYLGFAHRHKRVWYYSQPDSYLWSFNQTILCCTNCHQRIEYDSELSEKTFIKLRGEEHYE